MIVNYYDIHRCECIWDQDVPLLVAPENTAEQLLKMRGFYCGEDGKWYKQLSQLDSAYLNSMRNMDVVDFPTQSSISGNVFNMEKSPDNKKKANILSIISFLLMYGVALLNYLLYTIYDINILPISILSFLVGFILMIYVRVKYPKNYLAKVLMILYMILMILGLIFVITVIAWCESCMKDCSRCFW